MEVVSEAVILLAMVAVMFCEIMMRTAEPVAIVALVPVVATDEA